MKNDTIEKITLIITDELLKYKTKKDYNAMVVLSEILSKIKKLK